MGTKQKSIFTAAVFAALAASFPGDWIDADKIPFAAYSYFLTGLYTIRCYLFCLLTAALLSLSGAKISVAKEIAILSPVAAAGLLILGGIPFNDIVLYTRILTAAQASAAFILAAKALLRARSGAVSGGTPRTHSFGKLSRREKDVAALLLAGKKTDEIAEKLFISPATVKSHIQNIFRKYEVRNRMEFAHKANLKNV